MDMSTGYIKDDRGSINDDGNISSFAFCDTYHLYGEEYSCDTINKESAYAPNPLYATTIQNNSALCSYRERTYLWMLKICKEKNCSPSVSYTGMNYFDRYLSYVVIDESRAELLSWSCLHLASCVYDQIINHLSYRALCLVLSDSFSPQEIRCFLNELLVVLGFHLLVPSPFTEAGLLLSQIGCEELYYNVQSLLNGICLRYESIPISINAMVYTCLMLVWEFSFSDKSFPSVLRNNEEVTKSEFDQVVLLVKEQFPVMKSVCGRVYYRDLHMKCDHNQSPTTSEIL